MDNNSVTCLTAGVTSLEDLSVISDAETPKSGAVDRCARDVVRDQLRQFRGYHQQIEQTTTNIVRKPIVRGTSKFYSTILREWNLFAADYQGLKDPTNLKTAKDFILYFTQGRQGRNERGGRLTLAYTYTAWKSFMAAWSRQYHTSFTKSHQDTILNFIKGGEAGSPSLSRKTRPKRNFTRDDFLACVVQLWQNDWHDYDHERYRVGLHLLLLLHCNTSARRAEYEREWTYADITVSVVWLDHTKQPQLVIDFQRNKAKGLQDWESEQPQHMLYELVNLPYYCNSVLFFIAAALADDVLRDYHSWDDICAIPRPHQQKHIILHWHPEKAHWPVFPRSSRRGELDHDRTSATLTSKALVDLGYRAGFQDNVVLHAARREVLLQVDNYGYSCNERMRFAAHINADTYRRSYQTAMPMVDGQASYFQFQANGSELHDLRRSYGWRRNPYHQPTLKEAVRLCAHDSTQKDREADRGTSPIDGKERQKEYDQWRYQRDQLIREQNKREVASPYDGQVYESDFSQTRKLMPERDRLATLLFREGSLRDEVGRSIMDDLITLCRTRTPRTHCDGLNSSSIVCDSCSTTCTTNEEHKWWSHVYQCRKKLRKGSDDFTEFCFLCFEWYDDQSAWQEHARAHVDDPPLQCSMAIFRHNVIRPGLCPTCLGQGQYHQYTNLTMWKNHIQDHVLRRTSTTCPHPRCRESHKVEDHAALLDHLADVHSIRFDRAKRQKALDRHRLGDITSTPKAISFVHTNADHFARLSPTDDGAVLYDKQSQHEPEDTSLQAHTEMTDQDTRSTKQEPDLIQSDPIPNDGTVDDSDVADHASVNVLADSFSKSASEKVNHVNHAKGTDTIQTSLLNNVGKTRSRSTMSVIVNVPPVPDSWRDIPVMELEEEGPTVPVPEGHAAKQDTSTPSRRGRPRGSRNRATLRRERRLVTLAKVGRR